MTTASGLYNTVSSVHSGYYPKQIAQNFGTVQSLPCSVQSNAEGSNAQYMPYSSEVFGRTVNKKYSVSETVLLGDPTELLLSKECG